MNGGYVRGWGVVGGGGGVSGMEREREEGNVYLTTHSTHFIYGYMA